MEKETLNESLVLNPNPDVFVPKGEEEKWCQERGFEFRKLDNGIIILGVPRQVNDMAKAEIEFTFPSGGAFFDPPGKSGLHHLTEHLINPNLRIATAPFGVDLKASTGTRVMREVLEGAAHQQVKDYGVWPVVPMLKQKLATSLEISDDELMGHKRNVIVETHEDKSDFDRQIFQSTREIVLSSKNPQNTSILGVENDLKTISLQDVKDAWERIFTPNSLSVGILTHGQTGICRELTEQVAQEFASFPQRQKTLPIFDLVAATELNPSFKMGGFYEKPLAIKNGLVEISALWYRNLQPFSSPSFATIMFGDWLKDLFFFYVRENGWAYHANARSTIIGEEPNRFLTLDLTVQKETLSQAQTFTQELIAGFRKRLKQKTETDTFQKLIYKETKRRQADPMSMRDKLGWMTTGWSKWRRLIDGEKINEVGDKICLYDLSKLYDDIMNTDPAVLLVGDLN